MIAESLNIPKTLVLRILKDDLGKRMWRVLLLHIPRHLSKWEDRGTSCQDIIAMDDVDKFF
jgi:hypothetical protein